MEPIEPKIAEIKEYNKTGRRLIIACIIFSFAAILAVMGYWVTHNSNIGQWPQSSPTPAILKEINKIEVSEDKKAILNAETKAIIFAVEDAQKYLKDSGYGYQPKADPPRADNSDTLQTTNAKYAGDCFLDSALSNNNDNQKIVTQKIVFSTGCLVGDLPQTWIGVYNSVTRCSGDFQCKVAAPGIKFLVGGSGKNFIWSQDDKTITYEADLGLSGMTETRMIDSATGEILKREVKSTIDTSDWLTYGSTANAESYYERYKIKYPRELFYEAERATGTHELATFFKDK